MFVTGAIALAAMFLVAGVRPAEARVSVFVGGTFGVPAYPYYYPYAYPAYGYPVYPTAPPPGWVPGHWEWRYDEWRRPVRVWVPAYLR
jgi:hypothetical protein